MRTVYRIRLIVNLLLIAGLILGLKVSEGLAVLFGLSLPFWWAFGVLISRWIAVAMVNSLRCKGCGLEIPAVQRWTIGSYTDHAERHICNVKSPLDGSRIGQINCPQCEATILV